MNENESLTVTLTLENNEELECAVLNIFEAEEKEYIALLPLDENGDNTDGQIYLETDLFFAGQRPAVNVGLSVSRVGGAAQTRAIKRTAGTMRIDLARFRELEIFTQFSSDLDQATQKTLDHGKHLLELLKQPLYQPMSVSRQAVLLYIGTNGLLDDVPVEQVREFASGFADRIELEHRELALEVQRTGNLSAVAIETIRADLENYKKEKLTVA